VALSELGESEARAQVFWLGRILAARGMPRITLQAHLELLFDELAASRPEKRHRYEKLLRAAPSLRDARRRVIDDARFESLALEFETRAGAAAPLRGIGVLLVAAVADAVDGVPKAVESLERWLTDPNRFSPRWTETVRSMLEKIRSELIGRAR